MTTQYLEGVDQLTQKEYTTPIAEKNRLNFLKIYFFNSAAVSVIGFVT